MQEIKVEYVSIDKIKPYQRNARKHDSKSIEVIANSISEFGMADPIAVWGKENIVIEGHGRLLALKQLGYDKAPIIHLDYLTDEQRRAYTLAHNKTAEFSEWDMELLTDEAESIFNIDLSDFGFDLSDDEEEETEVIEDEVPQEVEPVAKMGDIWQLGRHRLMCGNSLEQTDIDKLLNGNRCELTFTDPPYQLDTQGGGILKKANSMKQIKENGVDSFDPSRLLLQSDTNIYCHNKPLIKAYIELAEDNKQPYDLCFYKKVGTIPNYKGHLMTDCEYIAVIGKQDPNKGLPKEMYSKCYIGKKDSDNDLSYSKPVELCAKYIKLYAKDNVLDLFGGSGSTLIACEQLGRNCFMMELDPHYVDVIIARWEKFTGQKAVLLNGNS